MEKIEVDRGKNDTGEMMNSKIGALTIIV